MEKRLVKVAKELNVGTTTIVEFLNNSGFDIENRPTSKVTEEMAQVLFQEFGKDLVIKQKADELNIGLRTNNSKPETPIKKPTEPPVNISLKTPKTETPPPIPEEKEEEEVPTSTPILEEQEQEKEVITPNAPKTRLKVLGKINLDNIGKKPQKKETPKEEEEEEEEEVNEKEADINEKEAKTEIKAVEELPEIKAEKIIEKEEKKVEETPQIKEDKVKEAPVEQTTSDKTTKEGQEIDEIIKAEAPELRGLKILGKIDTDKFKRPKKKKPVKEEKISLKNKKNVSSSDKDKKETTDEPRRRRRKRKKIIKPVSGNVQRSGAPVNRNRNNNRNNRNNRKEEVKEVSKKQIEDQIKATMARISGKGKNKRQKIRRDNRSQKREKQELQELEQKSDKLQLTEFISVSELASLMDVSPTEVITICMNLGYFVTLNQRLDAEVIEIVASEFEHEVEFISAEEQLEEEEEEIIDAPEDLKPRAPIVTVMGHVDHGKTSLLDYIRKAKVAEGEAGGITQHIGAYEVKVDDKKVTFLDTPGHEAFTAMRARGAKVTDIAIIIIAADDSIMPQTKEAISHAQAAGVPMIFAINKIDKDGAQPDRIKQQLAEMNLLVEEWGGKYQSHDISAKQGIGVDELLEKVALEAELLELKANPDRKGQGVTLEASLDKGRGFVVKALVQTGTLKIGDPIVSGEYSGKIKAMFNEHGKRIKKAGPSSPVLLLGLGGAPQAGEKFKVMDSEQEARQLATKRSQIVREQTNRAKKRISLGEIGRRLALGSFKELNLIIKGDVDGSIEALTDALLKLSIETVQVNVIHKAVGPITESDVLLASASDAIIIGFQVRPSLNARKLAEKEGVEVKLYSIIYQAIEEISSAIEGMLEPTKEEKITGEVEIREIYKISKVGTVAGSYVKEGRITRNSFIRVIRDGIVIYPVKEGATGELSSLKRFKDDVKEVKGGFECGLTVRNYNDIKVGDIIEPYEIVEVKQTLKKR